MLTAEAVHIANQLCQYGYFFPVNDSKTLTVKDDSSLYRFQVRYELMVGHNKVPGSLRDSLTSWSN